MLLNLVAGLGQNFPQKESLATGRDYSSIISRALTFPVDRSLCIACQTGVKLPICLFNAVIDFARGVIFGFDMPEWTLGVILSSWAGV